MQRYRRDEDASKIKSEPAATVEFTLARPRSRQATAAEPPAKPVPATCPGRVPRVARLMALAIKFEDMIARCEIRDYADLARLGYVSRARITQIMNLLNLAPDIQEEILFLPPAFGRGPITERHLRRLSSMIDWGEQRQFWGALRNVPEFARAVSLLRPGSAEQARCNGRNPLEPGVRPQGSGQRRRTAIPPCRGSKRRLANQGRDLSTPLLLGKLSQCAQPGGGCARAREVFRVEVRSAGDPTIVRHDSAGPHPGRNIRRCASRF